MKRHKEKGILPPIPPDCLLTGSPAVCSLWTLSEIFSFLKAYPIKSEHECPFLPLLHKGEHTINTVLYLDFFLLAL